MSKSRSYESEAKKLAAAIDIAIEAFQNECPSNFESHHQEHFINTYKGWKESCLNPEDKFKNLGSLKYTIQDVFTFFQEGSGPTVEYFWNKLEKAGLDFKRENKLGKILKRGKIKNRVEYDYVTDMLVVAQQKEMVTELEAQRLSEMLGKFENK